ncbi:ribosome biogenesis GTPase Der [Candidatus Saccharibacteria bacterium]|nr:ribosome biogenesis GTPase Der [Candidatus Saccharibacteria bacterium]
MASKLPTVAIIGRANAGKSSLFNRMVRAQQAIVAREAGTTRDSVIGKVEHAYHQFWLVDTAGLKDPNDEFEAGIQEQITEAADAADVILVIVDSSEYPGDEDRMVAKKALKSKKPVILVTNKADLKTALPDSEFLRLGIKPIIRTSAEHNSGIVDVLNAVVSLIPVAHEESPDDVLRIALIGRPNVGKSYLFNTLAGKQQALVADVAGTTRDLNRITLNYHQQAIELIDTAGVRRQGKQEVGIEKFSVLRTLQAIEESDICFLLMDVGELNTQLDQRLAGLIAEAGKGLALVVSKWDSVEGKDAFTRDALAPKIARNFDFVPWAPLIFTSSVTGQNVTKLFDLAIETDARRAQTTKTRVLNDLLQQAIQKHPPAGLKNTHPKLRYMVQTDTAPPWFVIYGSNLKFVHWSYKRYLERLLRETYNYAGTPIKFSFRDEKQIKMNKERAARGLPPVTKAYKKAMDAEKTPPLE